MRNGKRSGDNATPLDRPQEIKMIAFTCDGCGASLKIADKWSGRLGHCPHCGTDSPVPGYPRRTPKPVIIARIGCFPMLIAVSWGIMFALLLVGSRF